MSLTRYLTKSRFKLGLECPTKLYYTGKKEYANTKLEDKFLESLAQGGFQVGELAKLYFPSGVEIFEKDNAIAHEKTKPLMAQKNATIFEAAIRYDKFFIRADIIVKKGNVIHLIEVKAKGFSPTNSDFLNAKGDRVNPGWESYIADAAFQKYVIQLAYPLCKVHAHLMLANKDALATVDGLNQLFKIIENGRNTHAEFVGDRDNLPDFGKLLVQVNVDIEVGLFVQSFDDADFGDFNATADAFANAYANGDVLYRKEPLGTHCGGCEFQADNNEIAQGLKSGYRECWKKFARFKDKDFGRPSLFEIWKFNGKRKFIEQGTYFQDELNEADVITKPIPADTSEGLTTQERQWLQVDKSTRGDNSAYLDKINLKREMKTWTYPLHFIDFETSTVAIPFHKGRRPYEQTAFQFSHHTVDDKGQVGHRGEFISVEPGKFPNFDFVRALKTELESDSGTIFRYAPHENTVLNQIRDQLLDSSESDRTELCEFIESITERKQPNGTKVAGERNMVDLCALVARYYYHPATRGSNSLKAVLPATLGGSGWLKTRYSQPIYGTQEIPSRNFADWQWVTFDAEGGVINPYKLLPPVLSGLTAEQLDQFLTAEDSQIAEGGAALTAYGRMQFVEMSAAEREKIKQALLKYCELDTLAMVMLYEAWQNWVV